MGGEFWKHYDTIYAHKNYDREVEVILPLIGNATALLEIGCGTGEHTRRFAPHFQRTVALEMNHDAIEVARTKKFDGGVLIHEALEDFNGTGFGAAVALFNVTHQLPTQYWLNRFMRAVSKCLTPGAVFVFDCWNGEAVMADPPKEMIRSDDHRIVRLIPRYDDDRRVRVNMEVMLATGEQFEAHIDHQLWTIEEYVAALLGAGFSDIEVKRWMEPAFPATMADWKVMFVCPKGGRK